MILSIIILNYNTKDLTINCLESIIKQYEKELKNGEIEIVVVDNASSDGSVRAIQNYNSKFKIIENNENVGFAKGCNIGERIAKGEYILFFNSDTQVLDKGFLDMVQFLEKNPSFGILGGKLLNNNGSSQVSAGKFYNLFNLSLMLMGMERFGFLKNSPDKIAQADWVSGGCMMIRKAVFNSLKGFDENFFMYIEDMEFCYRAKKNKILTGFYPYARVKHKGQGSSSREFAIVNIYKGILYFYAKHKTPMERQIAKLLLTVKAKLAIFMGSIANNASVISTYRKALSF